MMADHEDAPILDDAADLLGPRKLRSELVYVPAWECRVRVSELTGAEARMVADLNEKKDKQLLAKVAQVVLVNSEGEKLFTSKQVEELADLSFDGLQQVVNASMALSGMSKKKDDKPGEDGAGASASSSA